MGEDVFGAGDGFEVGAGCGPYGFPFPFGVGTIHPAFNVSGLYPENALNSFLRIAARFVRVSLSNGRIKFRKVAIATAYFISFNALEPPTPT